MQKMLFSFKGRVSRGTFWTCFLVLFNLSLMTMFIDLFIGGHEKGIISLVAFLITLWPATAIQVKRWHDIDMSGWWILINIAPFVGSLLAFLINGFIPGTDGANRFGDNPKAQKI